MVACLSRPQHSGQSGTAFVARNRATKGSLDVVAGRAIEAGGLAGGAVELQDALAAGELVQAVDVLRDDAADSAVGFPACQDVVTGVRLGISEVAMGFAFLAPIFVAAGGTRHEFVEVHGAILRPHAAGRAEVGDAAFRADAGAGEDNGLSRRGKPMGDGFDDVGVHGHAEAPGHMAAKIRPVMRP
jgi:hypothetical protein